MNGYAAGERRTDPGRDRGRTGPDRTRDVRPVRELPQRNPQGAIGSRTLCPLLHPVCSGIAGQGHHQVSRSLFINHVSFPDNTAFHLLPTGQLQGAQVMVSLRQIQEQANANGRLDGHELRMLHEVLYADGKIDRQEVEFSSSCTSACETARITSSSSSTTRSRTTSWWTVGSAPRKRTGCVRSSSRTTGSMRKSTSSCTSSERDQAIQPRALRTPGGVQGGASVAGHIGKRHPRGLGKRFAHPLSASRAAPPNSIEETVRWLDEPRLPCPRRG